ncbi:MAG: hypothetical protein WDW38_011340 [Sanguina aurantia]
MDPSPSSPRPSPGNRGLRMLGALASARFSTESVSPESSQADVIVNTADGDALDPVITDHTAPAEPEPVPMLTDTPGNPLAEVTIHTDPTQPTAKPRRQAVKKAPNPALHTYSWLKIDEHGNSCPVQGDLFRTAHKYGLQTRDLRLLDPSLSSHYPPAILDRSGAIVVNLEFIKAVITTEFVIVVHPEDELVAAFVADLKAKLSAPKPSCPEWQPATIPEHGASQPSDAHSREEMKGVFHITAGGGGHGGGGMLRSALNMRGPLADSLELPYELKVLEVCLDTVSVHLELTTGSLETDAYPALDALTSRVSEDNLEKVRRIKNRLVRLMTRVETVHEVLDKFLKDDEDMHRLQLSANTRLQQQAQQSMAGTYPLMPSMPNMPNMLGAPPGMLGGTPMPATPPTPTLMHQTPTPTPFPTTPLPSPAHAAGGGAGGASPPPSSFFVASSPFAGAPEAAANVAGMASPAPGGGFPLPPLRTSGSGVVSADGSTHAAGGFAASSPQHSELRWQQQQQRYGSAKAASGWGGFDAGGVLGDGGGSGPIGIMPGMYMTLGGQSQHEQRLGQTPSRLSRQHRGLAGGSVTTIADAEDEEEVEEGGAAAEAYFMPIHNTFNRLQTLHEYIKDTEDLVNIDLDQRRNQLITITVVVSALTAAISLTSAAAGIFGMNLDNTTWLQPVEGVFILVCQTSCIIPMGFFILFMLWLWAYNLLI